MTVRFYILPVETVGNRNGPKYLQWMMAQAVLPQLANYTGDVVPGEPAATRIMTQLGAVDYFTGRPIVFISGDATYSSVVTAYNISTGALDFQAIPDFTPQAGQTFRVHTRWAMKDYGVIPTAIVAADVTPAQHTALAAQVGVIAVPDPIDSAVGTTRLAATRAAVESLNIPGNWIQATDSYRGVVRTVTGMFLYMQNVTGRTLQNPFTNGLNLSLTYAALPLIWREAIINAFKALYIEVPFTQWVRDGLMFGQMPEFLRDAIVSRILALYGVDLLGDGVAVDTIRFSEISPLWRQRVIGIAEDIYNTPSTVVGLSASSTVRDILKVMSDVWGEMPIKFGDLATL